MFGQATVYSLLIHQTRLLANPMPRNVILLGACLGFGALLMGVTPPGIAQTQSQEIEDISFNFVYSTVLGTGFYSTATERVFIMRMPLRWQLTQLDDRSSIELLLPVSIGIRDLRDDEGEFELPDQLMTASLLPGIAWDYLALDNWQIVPSISAGLAKDFEHGTTAWMYSIGVRSYAWWNWGKHQLGFGSRLLGAGQHLESIAGQQGFVMIENGLDWNYELPWKLGGYPLSSSIFILWQHFADDMDIPGVSGENVVVDNLYQLGFTFGFRETVVVASFIPISRAGFSIIRGNTAGGGDLKAISLNLGFPLSYF